MAKSLTGVVVSDRGQKTIVVSVATPKNHPLYRKAYSTSKKFMAHDEKEEAKPGDTVIITETRPLSARKRHVLSKITERAAISQADTVEAITAEPSTDLKAAEPKVEAKAEKKSVAKKAAKQAEVEEKS